MLKKKQIQILNLFRKNIFLKDSILGLAKRLKKAYPKTYEAVKELEKEGILKIDKIGKSNIVYLPLNNRSIPQLAFLDEQDNINKRIPNYEKIMAMPELLHYLVIITGSYANGTETKKSDLDAVIIVSDNENPIDVQKYLENKMLLFHPAVHLYVFKASDFKDMLTEKTENYGKEIFKKHLILRNAYLYYTVLSEAIENGFKG